MSRSDRFGQAFLASVRPEPQDTQDTQDSQDTPDSRHTRPTSKPRRARTTTTRAATTHPTTITAADEVSTSPAPTPSDTLRRPARGQGRHGPGRTEQLNVRLTPRLKRLAVVRAAREGVTVGDLVERLLVEHLSANGELDGDKEIHK